MKTLAAFAVMFSVALNAQELIADGQRYTSGRRVLVELLAGAEQPLTLPQVLDEEQSVIFGILNQQQAQGFHVLELSGDPGRIELLRALELGHDRLGVL